MGPTRADDGAGGSTVSLHEKFRCPVCRAVQYETHPIMGTGYKRCEREKCAATWMYAVVPLAPAGLAYLAVVCTSRERHLYSMRPTSEFLRALGVFDRLDPAA